MYKSLVAGALLSLFSATATAQTSLKLSDRALVRKAALAQKMTDEQKVATGYARLKSMLGVEESHTLGIIRMKDGTTEDDLRAQGVNVLRSRYGFAFVALPYSDAERIASLPGVRCFELARPVKTLMKESRAATGVDKIHQGIGLPQAYTGKGVICGIVDQGIDPNHLNFKNEDGSSRVGMLAYMKVNSNATSIDNLLNQKFYNRNTISTFTTDKNTTYHGTHTSGIMAGGYRGQVTTGQMNGDQTATVVQANNPYYGNAYEADLAMACGDIMDVTIAYGIDYILQYAEKEGKPSVINISLGSNDGPHDGSETIHQFFDLCAEKANAIICVAAGNEGDMKIASHKTFSATDQTLQCFIQGYDTEYQGESLINARSGNVGIYSNDGEPFEIQLVVYNKSRKKVASYYNLTISDATKEVGKYWVTSDDFKSQSSDIVDASLARYFNGYFGMGWTTDENTGRFYVLIDYYLYDNTLFNKKSNYILGFIVKGKDGQRVDAYCDGSFSHLTNCDIAGWDDGDYNGSINDMATAKNILVVGSYTTTEHWPTIDGAVYSPGYDLAAGTVTSFSSYGTLLDGRNLPHILAPGACIISSVNKFYNDAGNSNPSSTTARVTTTRGKECWGWAAGTSMATPQVTGAIALWLEADPKLTLEEIREIAIQTAYKDEYLSTADPVKVGAGKFDAYEGLKEVLRRKAAGIGNIHSTQKDLLLTPDGTNAFNVVLAGATSLDIKVYNAAGLMVASALTQGDEAYVSLAHMPKGTYVVSVNGKHSRCVLIK